MIFSIIERREIDIPANVVAEMATHIRNFQELEPDAPVSVEDLLNEAVRRGLIELPEKFSLDDGYEPEVTVAEIAEFLEIESDE